MTSIEDIYRYDQGRRFQNTNQVYHLPNDDEELKRLDVQHQAICLYLEKLYFGPVEDVVKRQLEKGTQPQILDVGTGSGTWAVQMAQQFSTTKVTGIDFVPVKREDAPPNLSFELCDVTKELDRFLEGSFDVVHVRFLVLGITDWHALIRGCLRLLRPGGVLLNIEPNLGVVQESSQANGPASEKLWKSVLGMWEKRGIDLSVISRITQYFGKLEAEKIIRQSETRFERIPIGEWHTDARLKEVGRLTMLDVESAIPALMPTLVGSGHSEAELKALQADVHAEYARAHGDLPVAFSYSIKA